MARIRTVKPEFWASEQVMECSRDARLLFIGIWNFCDDGGNHVASVKTIKAEVFPGDDLTSTDIRRLLDELLSNDLLIEYSSDNKDFLHVSGWHHQRIDRPTYKHPPFDPENSPPPRRLLDERSPPEGKGREGKGVKQVGSSTASAQISQSAREQAEQKLSPNVEAAKRMKLAGCARINPSHPDLLAAIDEGVTPDLLEACAIEAIERGKANPFAYGIAAARGRHREGAKPVQETGEPHADRSQSRSLSAVERIQRNILERREREAEAAQSGPGRLSGDAHG